MTDDNNPLIARIDERTELMLTQMKHIRDNQEKMTPELAVLVRADLPTRVRSLEYLMNFWVKIVGGAMALVTLALVALGRWNDFFR